MPAFATLAMPAMNRLTDRMQGYPAPLRAFLEPDLRSRGEVQSTTHWKVIEPSSIDWADWRATSGPLLSEIER